MLNQPTYALRNATVGFQVVNIHPFRHPATFDFIDGDYEFFNCASAVVALVNYRLRFKFDCGLGMMKANQIETQCGLFLPGNLGFRPLKRGHDGLKLTQKLIKRHALSCADDLNCHPIARHYYLPERFRITKYLLTCKVIRNTLIHMANVLSTDKQITIIAALAEGSSIRAIERMTGVHRDTIMRLGVRIGKGCARIMDERMRDLPCTDIQLDEIWGFIGKKQRHLTIEDGIDKGDVWTWVAVDRDTKAVPCFKVGKRTVGDATEFVGDLSGRLRNRVQISTDGLKAYNDAIDRAFGTDVDYGSIVKTYASVESITPERRYSAPEVIGIKKFVMMGDPSVDRISTSHVERLNATTRLYMKRLNRLTLAFSKKLENFEAAIGLHFASYNFVKRHSSIRMTPAMALGIENDFWSYADLVERAG